MKDNPDINPTQAVINELSRAWQDERSLTQMTLGQLIKALEALDPKQPIMKIHYPHSYRGYYCDLAFEITEEVVPVQDVLDNSRKCMGKIFEGYKGGDYMMGETTPLWLSEYGDNSGIRLMGLNAEGEVITPVTLREED